jgi:PAS domain S-box-containing protein
MSSGPQLLITITEKMPGRENMPNMSDKGCDLSKKEKEHYLFLQRSFKNFNKAAFKMQSAFSSLEQKFETIDKELEQKNADLERAISEKEEVRNYLHNILESLNTGVIVTDLNEKITIMNRCAGVFSGIPQGKAIGKSIRAILLEMTERDWKAVANNTGRLGILGKKIRMNNRIIDLFGAPLNSTSGKCIGTVYVLRDITRVEKLEEMAKRTEKFEAMSELAINIAHEIRNPLGSIELFASLLMKETKQKTDRERLFQIISSVKKMDNRITNLLFFTRKQEPMRDIINLHLVLKEVLVFTKQIFEKGGILLDSKYSPGIPFILGDSEMLKQVFLNILLNAMQAMPDGGCLRVETLIVDANVEIRFSDSGDGILPEHLPRIFDPFFSTKEKGAGLGLAIVHTIIDKHGGSIDVESPEGGTIFTIVFPLTPTNKSKKMRVGVSDLHAGK